MPSGKQALRDPAQAAKSILDQITGEAEKVMEPAVPVGKNAAAVELGRRGGKKRAENLLRPTGSGSRRRRLGSAGATRSPVNQTITRPMVKWRSPAFAGPLSRLLFGFTARSLERGHPGSSPPLGER